LIDHVDPQAGNYEGHLRKAFDAECRRLDLNLLIVVGHGLNDPVVARAAHNSVYELMHPDCVDGVVLVSAGLGMHSGIEAIRRLCDGYRAMPMCSVGLAVPGVPSVLFDNRAGFGALLTHLIEVHGCRRLAFVAGPTENPDAQIRVETYRDVLAQYGIPFEPALVLPGEFTVHHARAATLSALDQGLRCDAIVAANDGMALGALQALRARGVRVPRDVLLTGFDDVIMARLANPPLTTVRQPLERMATLAVRLVVEQMAGHSVRGSVELPVEFVPRRSCGCGSRAAGRSLHPPVEVTQSRSRLVRERAVRLGEQLDRCFDSTGTESLARRLLTALELELGGQTGRFLTVLEDALEEVGEENHRYEQFQSAVTVLRDELTPISCPELEALWHDARRLISAKNTREQARQRAALDTAYVRVLTSGERLSTAGDLGDLRRVLTEELPQMQVRTAFIARYVDTSRRELEAFLCLREGEPFVPPELRYRATRLLPPRATVDLPRLTALVLPLTSEAEQLGVAVFELGSGVTVYEMLRDQISAALQTSALQAEIVHQTALHERSVQERLATAERMRSLSVLAGGVAHDLNNALGPLVALPDVVLQELGGLLGHEWLNGSELRADLELVKLASLRAAQTIKDLLTLGRQGQPIRQPLDLNRVVTGCLASDPSRVAEHEQRRIELRLELCDEPLVVVGSEPHLARAVSNLVRNAVEAIADAGTITVKTERVHLTEVHTGYEIVEPGDYVVVSVRDTGQGIAQSDVYRVFEPFFSKKRLRDASGSGLGLAIVHGVVKDHEGYIDVESAVGSGTRFTLYLPSRAGSARYSETPELPPRGSARVLVVDDDPVQLRTALRVLGRLGYEVTAVDSGAKAWELFSQAASSREPPAPSPFELVVMDMILNESEDGLEVFERIQGEFASLRGIIVSGHAPTGRAELAIARGLTWLAKPYTADALARTVQTVLASPPTTGV
jgi:DNA-binding LacI/PurR family transcriptional regulator/signal transduction histidine kinase/ActR/RegA family two-component response regulator